MSTILKALRRLEEQKSAATERPLRDEVVLTPRRARRRNGVVIAVAAAIAFGLVGAALVALFDRVPEPRAERAGVEAAEIDVAASPERDDSIVEERVSEVTVASPAPNLRGVEVPVVPLPPSDPDFEIVRPDSKPRPFIPEMQVDSGSYTEPHGVTRPTRRVPPPMPEPERFDAEGSATDDPSPLHVERTQWHPSPDRRVAWVEVEDVTSLREVREGERIGPYVVRAIEPASVLFSKGSAELRREVGR